MTWPISLCTACSPWLPVTELAPVCAAAGITGLDIAVKPHRYNPAKPFNFWSNNAAVIDQATLEEQLPAIKTALAEHGLVCRMISGYSRSQQYADATRLAAAAVVLGASEVRIGIAAPEPGRARAQVNETQSNWRELAVIAKSHGIRFVLELHDNTIATGASGALRLIDGLAPAQVGVILDIGNTAMQGNEPLAMAIDLLGPYLAHVHVKDMLFKPSAAWNGISYASVPLGEGSLRWTDNLRLLREKGYQGWLAIENFTGLDRGPERLAEDAAWIRARIAESETVPAPT